MKAGTIGLRARYARKGLEGDAAMDPSTRVMLLRQLYLAAMERRKFSLALGISESMLTLNVLTDVAHQDAARACLGQKDLDRALRHLRLAARTGPASRRSFHLSMLGALLLLNDRAATAILPLAIAARWSTTDKAICRTQLALAKYAADEPLDCDLEGLRFDLENSSHRRGYDEYLLGELCALLGDARAAQRYFQSFVERTTSGRVSLAIALQGEIRRAKQFLSTLKRSKRA
jgi:tetratricopeptide (TPR) repeat protein